jgi:hypothetical protein
MISSTLLAERSLIRKIFIENKIIINKQDALKKNFIKTSQKLFKQQTSSSKKVIKL